MRANKIYYTDFRDIHAKFEWEIIFTIFSMYIRNFAVGSSVYLLFIAPQSASIKYIYHVCLAVQNNYDKATGNRKNLTTTKIGPFSFIIQSQLCGFFSSGSFSHHWHSINNECLCQLMEKFISLIYSLR